MSSRAPPPQKLSQHTASMQNPLVHWLLLEHAAPRANSACCVRPTSSASATTGPERHATTNINVTNANRSVWRMVLSRSAF